MVDVAHSTLTGSDLHEIKGAAAATVNKVPIADGAGSAPFGLIPAASLTAAANPFAAQLLHLQETNAVTSYSGGNNTVNLNTVLTNEISSATLVSKQISLPAGTYYTEGFANVRAGATSITYQAALRNITTSAYLLSGSVVSLGLAASVTTTIPSLISGRFTLAGTSTLELWMWASSGVGVSGTTLGVATDVHNDLKIWKIA